MIHKLNKLRTNTEQGFTLIELLVVIVIIGVLAAIALPIFLNQQKVAVDAKTVSDARTANIAIKTWNTKNVTANIFDVNAIRATQTYSEGTSMTLIGTPQDYCIKAFNGNGKQYLSNSGPYYIYVSLTGEMGSANDVGYVSSLSCSANTAPHWSIQ